MALSTLLLALALACGGEDDPATPPAPASEASSLGDLLGNAPPPFVAPDLETISGEAGPTSTAGAATADNDEPIPESQACSEARATLRSSRSEVDALRARELTPAQDAVNNAQAAFDAYIASTEASAVDINKLTSLQDRIKSTLARQERVAQQIANQEAGLFPLVQDVDSLCGRL